MTILGELQRLFDEAGPLVAVRESRFEGDPTFVTGYHLGFANLSATFLADGEFDTVKAVLAPAGSAGDVDVSSLVPWSRGVGLEVTWAWELTNHQRYVDGVRLQFGLGDNRVLVEFVVVGSQFHLFEPARRLAPPNQPLQRT
jgi:hypothetical protein